VARMNRIASGAARGRDQRANIQIARRRGRRTDTNGAVRKLRMHRATIRLGEYGHGLQPRLMTGPDQSDGDLATVGDQHTRHPPASAITRIVSPNSPIAAFSG